ncbi:MAG TPA: polymer-forming cytoskeletal protein, partial [Lachnospiraceae bacterium]|nr:polymer-forming cytoskeletal protein [Lachnospiraceae bacterium]
MKKTLKFTMAAFLAFAAAIFFIPQTIVSADEVSLPVSEEINESDSVGNVFYAGDSTVLDNTLAKKDVYMFGNSCKFNNSDISQDAIIAGNTISFKDTAIEGSMRTAGYSILINNTTVSHNITAAANSIDIDSGSTCDAALLCGSSVSFDGTCGDLKVAAGTVTINGVVTGDALISADKISIGPNAVINGNLKVESGKEPTISEKASIENLDFEKVENHSEMIEKVSFGAMVAHKLLSRLYWIPALALIALTFCFIFGKALDGSGAMLKKKPAIMLGSGAITLFALPVALILLCITYIGLPLAGLILLLMLPVMFFAVTF